MKEPTKQKADGTTAQGAAENVENTTTVTNLVTPDLAVPDSGVGPMHFATPEEEALYKAQLEAKAKLSELENPADAALYKAQLAAQAKLNREQPSEDAALLKAQLQAQAELSGQTLQPDQLSNHMYSANAGMPLPMDTTMPMLPVTSATPASAGFAASTSFSTAQPMESVQGELTASMGQMASPQPSLGQPMVPPQNQPMVPPLNQSLPHTRMGPHFGMRGNSAPYQRFPGVRTSSTRPGFQTRFPRPQMSGSNTGTPRLEHETKHQDLDRHNKVTSEYKAKSSSVEEALKKSINAKSDDFSQSGDGRRGSRESRSRGNSKEKDFNRTDDDLHKGSKNDNSDKKSFSQQDGNLDKQPFSQRDSISDKKPFSQRDNDNSDKKPFSQRVNDNSDKKPFSQRVNDNSDKKPFSQRDNADSDKKPFSQRGNDNSDRQPFSQRDSVHGEKRKDPGSRSPDSHKRLKRGGEREEKNSQRRGSRSPGRRKISRSPDSEHGQKSRGRSGYDEFGKPPRDRERFVKHRGPRDSLHERHRTSSSYDRELNTDHLNDFEERYNRQQENDIENFVRNTFQQNSHEQDEYVDLESIERQMLEADLELGRMGHGSKIAEHRGSSERFGDSFDRRARKYEWRRSRSPTHRGHYDDRKPGHNNRSRSSDRYSDYNRDRYRVCINEYLLVSFFSEYHICGIFLLQLE